MRIIIAGGRTFNDYDKLQTEVNQILVYLSSKWGWRKSDPNKNYSTIIHDERIEIVSGTANGADKLGERYAEKYKIPIRRFPADWDGLGKKAGYVRNEQMAKYAEKDNGVLIAFWDEKSKGTKHMIDLAKKYGLQVFVVNY
jgi:hypothetical protein